MRMFHSSARISSFLGKCYFTVTPSCVPDWDQNSSRYDAWSLSKWTLRQGPRVITASVAAPIRVKNISILRYFLLKF